MYMRNADAAIIVFDLTNRQSFEDVAKWENGKSGYIYFCYMYTYLIS